MRPVCSYFHQNTQLEFDAHSTKMTKPVVEQLKKMTAEVVADKKFCKAMTSYVEEDKRNLLTVTVFDGKTTFSASPKIARIMEDHPDVLETLKEIFEKKLAVQEDVLEKPDLKVVTDISLPFLFAPFKDKKRGWTKDNVSEQLILYLNILGYGIGGDKSLVKTKFKTATKPEWWPSSIDFDAYTHPSHAKLQDNEDIIESLFKHFDLDPMKHAKEGEIVQKQAKNPKKGNLLDSSILEDPVILSGGKEKDVDHDSVDFEKFVSNIQSKSDEPTGSKRKNLEGGGERTKKKVLKNPIGEPSEKSDYEKIRDQNVKERKEEQARLGL